MKHLLNQNGIAHLRELREKRTLFAFDFDGTLCPIVSNPKDAKLSSHTKELLVGLADLAPVAVISGRALDDLRPRINCELIRLIGNHGAEGVHQDENRSSSIQICSEWISQLQQKQKLFHLDSPQSEVFIEDKAISISLHYRNSSNIAEVEKLLLSCTKKLKPKPRIILGSCVINLVPQGSPNKGDALLKLMESLQCVHALFIGDDITDEDVFNLQDNRVVGVRVVPIPGTKANYFLNNQEEVDTVLKFVKTLSL